MPTMTQAGYTPPKQAPKKEQKPQTPKKKKKKKRNKCINGAAAASLAIFALAAAIGAGTIFVYTKTQPYVHTFAPGTLLMGYPLDGATREQAEALIDQLAQEHAGGWQAEITCMQQTYTLTAQDVSLGMDKEATLAPLWAAAREGGMFARYIDMLKLSREPVSVRPVLEYDLTPVDVVLEIIRADVECAPVDATMTFRPGSASPFAFTDDETGYALDTTGVRERIEKALQALEPVSIALEPTVLEPQIYRTELENAVSLRSRVVMALEMDEAAAHNAALAAEALNGLRVEPGDTLSFNEAVGARTQERGYVNAQESAYGEDVSGVGGGVCQTATALYRAALLGGIEVAERSAGVRPVSYCEMGQEAAVSGQGLDLVLRNQTDFPLFITARTYEQDDGMMLEMMLIGEALGRRYALVSEYEETALIEEPVYVRDREGKYATYTDERVPVGKALPGYRAAVARVTLDGDGQEIGRETVNESVYEAAAPTIYVGVTERE